MAKKRGDMPEAVCPECGGHYHGWALLEAKHQTCLKCGEKLVIQKEDRGQNV